MDREGMRTLRKLELSEDDKKKPKAILDTLKCKFKPRQNVIIESFRFNKRQEQAGETIEEYMEALKKLSETCEFGSL